MAGTELRSIGHMKKGSTIVIDGVACKVNDTSTSRPGKHGHAKVRLVATGLFDGRKREIVMPGHDNVEVPIIEKKSAQVLSIREDEVNGEKVSFANVMDSESFETFDMKVDDEVENGPVTEGCEVLYWEVLDDKIIKQVKN